ncbi:MAG TPA: thiamine-phosphate kinase [Geobacteraceae bacterium]
MKLGQIGEFGLIDRIAARVTASRQVNIGIGDDAAAVAPSPGMLTLVTTDMLVEGIHFDLALTDARSLGRKALSVNLSDIAAMGGNPRQALLALAIPRELPVEFLDSFIDGVLSRGTEFDVTLIGGDTCASPSGLTISITVMGEQLPERVVSRGGARPGDLIFVTGTLGDSALGLELLRRGIRDGGPVTRHLDPAPRVREGVALAATGLPTAMIDVSDGLLADLGHILRLSQVGACLELAQLPLSESFTAEGQGSSSDPFGLALSGGEDYELLFTAPPSAEAAIRSLLASHATLVTVIGHITTAGELRISAPDGGEYRPQRQGYNHFQ